MIKFYTEYAEKWEKALATSGILEKELEAPEYENAILLPLRKRKDSPAAAPNGYHEGGVCDKDYNFLAGLERKYPRAEANFGCIQSYTPKAVNYRDETVIFGGVLIDHFGHTLVDSLTRMWYFAKNPDTPHKFAFLMMTNHEKFYKDFFELAGLTEDRYEIITEATQFKKVIVPDQALFCLTRNVHPDWLLFFDKIKENVRRQCDEPSFDKVYLTRTQLPAEKIFEANEAFFENFYRTRGYTIVAPEKLSLAEQINIIMHAASVVTTMGTLSHMMVFAKKNTDCTVLLRSASELINPQIVIDRLKEHTSSYIQATKDLLPSPHSRGVPLYFPTEYFVKYLTDREIPYKKAEVEVEIGSVMEEYVRKYALNYSDPQAYKRLANFTAFDYVNSMNYALYGVKLDKKKYQKSKSVLENEKLKKELEKYDLSQQENEELRKENEKLKEENQKLKKELAKSKKELEKIKKSTSWKLTKPIRFLAKLFRKKG